MNSACTDAELTTMLSLARAGITDLVAAQRAVLG